LFTSSSSSSERSNAELLQRASSKVDQAAAYTLNVSLYTAKSEATRAVESAGSDHRPQNG